MRFNLVHSVMDRFEVRFTLVRQGWTFIEKSTTDDNLIWTYVKNGITLDVIMPF